MTQSILLVDDNRVIRQVLRGMFEAIGFVCSESEDGEQAVAEAGRLKPELIVLDHSMPVINGLEAAPLLRKLLPHTPIIVHDVRESRICHSSSRRRGHGSGLKR